MVERLRIRFLYRRGERLGVTRCEGVTGTVWYRRYVERPDQSPLCEYRLDFGDGVYMWVAEADLRPPPQQKEP